MNCRFVRCSLVLMLAVSIKAPAAVPTDPAAVTLGVSAGEDEERALGDLLVPLWRDSTRALLLDARYSLDDDSEEEASIGLVARCLIEEWNTILGANLFYDSRWTRRDSHFSQLGMGLELLGKWVDARFNYYLPEHKEELVDSFTQTTVEEQRRTWWSDPYATGHRIRQKRISETRTITTTYLFERFEQAREGWDGEIGVRLPLPTDLPETRLFGGYYHWDAEYVGNPDIEGPKARVEIRALPRIFLDAEWYSDKELNGSHWMAGARLVLPFDPGELARGRNPFRGGPDFRHLTASERLVHEMVIRDPKIRLEDSGYRENVAARRVEVHTKRRVKKYTLMDDVTFVDGDNDSGVENGTAEHPYDTVQEGVNNAFGQRNVYVFAAHQSYRENAVLSAGVRLYGEGHAIPGHGGKSFGGTRFPTIDGGSQGPSLTLADECLVTGFRIINSDLGGAPQNDPLFGYAGYERAGLYGANASGYQLEDNLVEGCSHGAMLFADSLAEYYALLQGNLFLGNAGRGAWVEVRDTPDVTVELVGNTYAANTGDGLLCAFDGCESVFVPQVGDWAEGNVGAGMWMQAANGDDVFYYGTGLSAFENLGSGLEFMFAATSIVTTWLMDSEAYSNGNYGILLTSDAIFLPFVSCEGLSVWDNGNNGLDVGARGDMSAEVLIADTWAGYNQGDGVSAYAISSAGFAGIGVGADWADAAAFLSDLQDGLFGDIAQAVRDALTRQLSPVVSELNSGRGINLRVTGATMAAAWIFGADSSGNDAENIRASADSALGSGWLGLTHSTASDSVLSGGVTGNVSGTSAFFGLADCRAEDNAGYGVAVNLQSMAALQGFGEQSVFQGNGGNGIMLTGAAFTPVVDFGGGTLGSVGWNSIYGNTGVGFANAVGLATIEDNYWGGAAPVAGVDYTGAADPGDHWLTDDPNQ